MANAQKHTRGAVGHLGKHYERARDEKGEYVQFGNQDINTELSHLNYNLAPDRNMSHSEYVKQRTGEVYCLNRKDVNVMCSWAVTLPKDFPADQQEEFFKKTYDFLKDRYGGEKNVISSYVHLDENRPHMHFAFVPVVQDRKKGHLKVSAKECISRKDLSTFHKDFSKAMEQHFGRDVGILNDATKDGNKSIEELKKKSAIERLNEVENKSQEIMTKTHQEASKIVFKAQKQAKGIEDSLVPLRAEYKAREAFIDQSIKASDVSMMYPNYAEIVKKGLIKKQEFVVVPKDKWEAKHVSASQINAMKRQQEAFEEEIKTLKQSFSGELENKIRELEKENARLKKDLKRESENIEPKYAKMINDAREQSLDYRRKFVNLEKYTKKLESENSIMLRIFDQSGQLDNIKRHIKQVQESELQKQKTLDFMEEQS